MLTYFANCLSLLKRSAEESWPRYPCFCTTMPLLTGHMLDKPLYLNCVFEEMCHPPYSPDQTPNHHHHYHHLKVCYCPYYSQEHRCMTMYVWEEGLHETTREQDCFKFSLKNRERRQLSGVLWKLIPCRWTRMHMVFVIWKTRMIGLPYAEENMMMTMC